MPDTLSPASFRDPAGFLFTCNGVLLRQINQAGRADHEKFMASGLYDALVRDQLIVAHTTVSGPPLTADGWQVIQPERLPFVSYPYEWSFSQLRDAALLTLKIAERALDHGLQLKDASAYNILFHGCRPVFIDTLSFAAYRAGEPWPAYRQFCQHFLAPLTLMAYRDIRLGLMLRDHIDGIPLDLAAKLLPLRARLRPSLAAHLVLHARSQRRHADDSARPRGTVNEFQLRALLDNLTGTITSLSWEPRGTEWSDYYADTNYSAAARAAKETTVAGWLAGIKPGSVLDLGANDGRYSRLAVATGAFTIAADADPAAVEKSYRQGRAAGESNLLPLVIDLANPSPALGWAHEERDALLARGPADCLLALALVHHLALGNNLPLDRIAGFFAAAGRQLIVEFVPKDDSQAQRLLGTRGDIFPAYTEDHFRAAFARHFTLASRVTIPDSSRTLWHWTQQA